MNRVASSLALIIVGCAVVYALPTISSGSSPDSMFDSIIPEDSRDSPEIEFPVGWDGKEVAAAAKRLEGQAASLTTKNPQTVNAMQWSPHFRCFMSDFFKATCEPQVKRMLPIFVEEHKLDFINLGMFQIEHPATYFEKELKAFKHVTYACGRDTITFAFNSEIWEPMEREGLTDKEWPEDAKLEKVLEPDADNINDVACSNAKTEGQPDKVVVDRVYAVMGFTRKTDSEDRVIVVGGHMPHPPGGTSGNPDAAPAEILPVLNDHIGEKIKHIKGQLGWANAQIVVIADFNVDSNSLGFPNYGHRSRAFDSSDDIKKAFEQMSDLTWTKFVSNMLGMIRAPSETDAKVGDDVVMNAEDKHKPATVAYALEQPNGGWIAQPELENSEMFESLGMLSTAQETMRFGTCCASKPSGFFPPGRDFYEVIFPYAFDRILTSGTELETKMPLHDHLRKLDRRHFADTPANRLLYPDFYFAKGAAKVLQEALLQGDFHMPIVAEIKYTPITAPTVSARH